MGDMFGLKGLLVNFVVRRVKKLVPAWSLPGSVSFNDALTQGRGKTLKPVKVSVDDVAWKVGFSDSANLRRAVRRWTGKTINEVRSEK